jgi:hypothetical protein
MKNESISKMSMKQIFLSVLVVFNLQAGTAQTTVNPTGVYSSYFGGSGNEWGQAIAVDSLGYVYIAGHSLSLNLPTSSAYQPNNAGNSDAFIAKLSPDMTQIIFCTYLGGTENDGIWDVVLDKNSNIYATGYTASVNFPVTKNAYDNVHNGDFDVFFVKMSPDGELLYSSFFGGSGKEQARSLFMDDSLNIYVTGFTNSRNFPVKSAYSNTYNGGNGNQYGYGGDAYVIKFNMKYDTLVFSTYLGGSGNEWGYGIAVDNDYNVYIAGQSESVDFPTKNGFDSIYAENTDGFISKLSNTGNELIYSSYFGGSNFDVLDALAVNDKNEAYFIGGTASSGLDCSDFAFYKNLNGGEDIVIGKVSASGNTLEYLSYFGGSKTDFGKWGCSKLQLLDSSTIILVSNTLSTNLPVTVNAFDNNFSGGSDYGDLFISKLNIDKKENLYTSYFGGSGEEGAHLGIACLNDSTVYISSWTSSLNLYTSPDALFTKHQGAQSDVFLFRANLNAQAPTSVKNLLGTSELQIFPNPASKTIQIKGIENLLNKSTYHLTDINGKTIKQGKLDAESIDISALPKGFYLFGLNTHKGIITEKIVVE